MSEDHRSAAERFVSKFLDYIYKTDIEDYFNKTTQKMERSAGVDALVKQAEAVFPGRPLNGKSAQAENEKLSEADKDAAIAASPGVVDTREMFARRVAKNGGTHKLLRDLFDGKSDAHDRVAEFLAAEDGEKEFSSGKPVS